MKKYILACAVAVSVAVAGCTSFEHTSTTTSPSGTGVAALMGTWASASATGIPSITTCVDFKWNATEQTATTAKGSFTATCAGDLKVAGTASGTLTGTTIAWGANGTTTLPGQTACPVTLTGTAELGANSIRVPYSGSTCLGPVSGVEILNRK